MDGSQIGKDFKRAWDDIHEQEGTDLVAHDEVTDVHVEMEHKEASSIHPSTIHPHIHPYTTKRAQDYQGLSKVIRVFICFLFL